MNFWPGCIRKTEVPQLYGERGFSRPASVIPARRAGSRLQPANIGNGLANTAGAGFGGLRLLDGQDVPALAAVGELREGITGGGARCPEQPPDQPESQACAARHQPRRRLRPLHRRRRRVRPHVGANRDEGPSAHRRHSARIAEAVDRDPDLRPLAGPECLSCRRWRKLTILLTTCGSWPAATWPP